MALLFRDGYRGGPGASGPWGPLSAVPHSDGPAALAHETGLIEVREAAGLSLFQLLFSLRVHSHAAQASPGHGGNTDKRGFIQRPNTEFSTERERQRGKERENWRDGVWP